jgi:hypothetical protein
MWVDIHTATLITRHKSESRKPQVVTCRTASLCCCYCFSLGVYCLQYQLYAGPHTQEIWNCGKVTLGLQVRVIRMDGAVYTHPPSMLRHSCCGSSCCGIDDLAYEYCPGYFHLVVSLRLFKSNLRVCLSHGVLSLWTRLTRVHSLYLSVRGSHS